MSFAFTYDPGSNTVRPVVIRSRIRWNVEPVPLNPNFRVVVAPGCPWKDRVTVTEKEIIEAGKAVRFTVALQGRFTLGEYEALVAGKEPIRLSVTLYPLAAPVPTIGVPVPSGPGPMTEVVVIGPPDFSPAALELSPESVPDASDGTPMAALTARLTFSDLLVPTDAEIAGLARQDWFRVATRGDRVGLVTETKEGGGKRALFRAHGLGPGISGNDSFDVGAAVRVGGRRVEQRTTLTLVPKKTYVLRVSEDHLSVSQGRPAAFHARLLEETAPRKEVPVPKAVITVAESAETAGKLRVSVREGTGRVDCTVTQVSGASGESAGLIVTARMGRESFSHRVAVDLGEAPSVVLVTAFDPRGGTSLDPFDPESVVVIDARLDPGPGATLGDRERNATIRFEAAQVDNLDVSCRPLNAVDEPWWYAAEVRARVTGPADTRLPDAVEVEVVATVGRSDLTRDTVRIPLGLQARLDVSPGEVSLLAHPENRQGRAPAPPHVDVSLAVSTFSGRAWTYELFADDDARGLVVVDGPQEAGDGASFRVTVSPDAAPAEPPIGTGAWERRVLLHPVATSGDLVLRGPDVPVTVSFEGLYIARIYTWQRGGWKTSGHETTVPLRVDLPMKDPHRVAFVRFAMMTWNGTRVEDNPRLADSIAFERPESDSEPARILFSLGDLVKPERHPDPYSGLEGAWRFEFRRFVPGDGGTYPAGIVACSGPWECAVPLEIVTAGRTRKIGTLSEEQTRLLVFIEDVIPRERPEYSILVHDLAALGKKHAGARDYAIIREVIWEVAQRIWQEDQQDYLTWKPWETTILTGLGAAKKVGDFAFMAVVGYYTRNLGFAASFASQQFVPLLKDELIEFFNFYADRYEAGEDDLQAAWWRYYELNRARWFEMQVVAGVDTVIMVNFDPRNPSVRILVVLWIWKFVYHKVRPKPNGEACSYYEAFEASSWDMAHLAFAMVFQEFLNASGDRTLNEAWVKATRQGGAGARGPPKPLSQMPADMLWNRLRKGLHKDGGGEWVALEGDVLDLMRHPEQVRRLDREGEFDLRAGFERTRQKIYERHDAQLVESLKAAHPEYAGKDIIVAEFGTPGAKPGEKLNTDRDYRVVEVLEWNPDGTPRVVREVPRTKWEDSSYEIFARETGCPNWKDPVAAKEWAEQRQQLGTDAIHEEACMDFKDQGHIRWDDATGSFVRTVEPSMQSNVTRVAAGHGRLYDPPGIAQMYRTKVGDAYRNFGAPEAFVQASKGVKMLDKVRNGYSMNHEIPDLPDNFRRAADAVHEAAKHPWDPAEIQRANRALEKEGFGDITSFTEAMANGWQSLTLAKPKVGG
ncbi:MAG: hypothetical protein GXY82_10240 [Methanospirillum sp.]|nr:hypothetical protein [Methanospirillum sp.]